MYKRINWAFVASMTLVLGLLLFIWGLIYNAFTIMNVSTSFTNTMLHSQFLIGYAIMVISAFKLKWKVFGYVLLVLAALPILYVTIDLLTSKAT
jgi:hypothetical protein